MVNPHSENAPQAFIDKFRYNAKRASLVQSRIKALERLGETEVVEDDPEYIFRRVIIPPKGVLSDNFKEKESKMSKSKRPRSSGAPLPIQMLFVKSKKMLSIMLAQNLCLTCSRTFEIMDPKVRSSVFFFLNNSGL